MSGNGDAANLYRGGANCPTSEPGISSGLMLAQYTAAALVAELRSKGVEAHEW